VDGGWADGNKSNLDGDGTLVDGQAMRMGDHLLGLVCTIEGPIVESGVESQQEWAL